MKEIVLSAKPHIFNVWSFPKIFSDLGIEKVKGNTLHLSISLPLLSVKLSFLFGYI